MTDQFHKYPSSKNRDRCWNNINRDYHNPVWQKSWFWNSFHADVPYAAIQSIYRYVSCHSYLKLV